MYAKNPYIACTAEIIDDRAKWCTMTEEDINIHKIVRYAISLTATCMSYKPLFHVKICKSDVGANKASIFVSWY